MTTKLTIGTVAGEPGADAVLDARRFNRHTFWCGQSGSGKTYALGVVLEQLLLETDLPMVIFDPNADYVRLSEPRVDADPADASRLTDRDIRVFRSSSGVGEPLRVRYLDLSSSSKAALLQLDPIADAEEYNVLLRADVRRDAFDEDTVVERLRTSSDPGEVRLSYRMENLEVLEWSLWSRGSGSVIDEIDRRPRATVMDLGGFPPLGVEGRGVGGTGALVGATGGAATAPHRDRRGAQRVFTRARDRRRACPDPAADPDRRGGTEVRPLAPVVDPASGQNPPQCAVPVRQPGSHADQLAARPDGAGRGVRLRRRRSDPAGERFPTGAGSVRRGLHLRAERHPDGSSSDRGSRR